ncbi:threonine ammonia-lyase [Roseibium salinum]|uniref:Pyridoxal-phosphate dependent enzyme n=1 Tax=Roseibium salinum TaxID=1604349 RepID=A0ABT3QWZ8_9HYPH|nr:pyridoxal-phosphate dependent enzyme [Roseibium sp. DSM 29163]MCX2721454.1 pyridoxal-phosphate dependent enzyme [Roseibium sp. DSM 29163]MDN3721928.1 pyridoxal-phosphate dependent enzyme [Roseibium salinum]
MTTLPLPSADLIAAAAKSIDPVFTGSPLISQTSADDALDLRLFAKVETLNPIRCFKGRGADAWMSAQQGTGRTFVAASAGNFGQALAYAAASRGHRTVIFAARSANRRKIDAMRRLGAEVILEGDDFDMAKAAAREFAATQDLSFIEDGAHPAIAEGAGTIALEITETLKGRGIAPDAVIAPLGNGALLTGLGAWLRAALPGCRVVGVVAAGARAMKLSWETGRLETTAAAATCADGIAVRDPVPYALECMRHSVDAVHTVDEEAIHAAMAFCRDHYGLVVEPAGAAGIAALLQHPDLFAGKTVATVLCGGNVER